MARFHATPNGLVQFTAEEEAYQDAQDVQNQIDLAEQTRTKYQRDRADEYPPIGDQLDALFKAGVFPAEMAATLQAVKNKYPKLS